MILSALVLGALTAYYFGLRNGAYAAVTTFVLSVVAMFMPRFALPIHIAMAVGAIIVWRIGSKRPRPADAALAVRFVRRSVKRAWSTFGGSDKRDKD